MISSQCDAPMKTWLCAHMKWCTKVSTHYKKRSKNSNSLKSSCVFFRWLALFFAIHLTLRETSFIQYFNFGCLDLIFIRFDVLFRLFSFSHFVWTVWLKANEMRASVRTCSYCEPKFNWRFDAVHHIAITIRCSTLCVRIPTGLSFLGANKITCVNRDKLKSTNKLNFNKKK